jgi:2,3-bisphosphoglycerate-independent phosphoglycerate mutase
MYEINTKNGEFERDKSTGQLKSKTAHTLNPVPFIIFDPSYSGEYVLNKEIADAGLGNVAATILNMMGFDAPDDYLPSLISYTGK